MSDGKVSKIRTGWGFIEQPDESEIYFTQKDLRGIAFKELKKGDAVSFEIGIKDDGKTFATNIQKTNSPAIVNATVTRSPSEQVKNFWSVLWKGSWQTSRQAWNLRSLRSCCCAFQVFTHYTNMTQNSRRDALMASLFVTVQR